MSTKKFFLILFVIYLLLRISLITVLPLIRDEVLYSVMIEEQIDYQSWIPTFLGELTGWKPILFFWTYAPFVFVLKMLPVPLEVVYRLPSVLFGFINVYLTYLIIKKFEDEETAKFCAIIYAFVFLVIYVNNTVLTDTLMSTFVLLAFFVYLKTEWGDKRFLLAGAISIAAFFVKLIVAGMIPVFALAYIVTKDKKMLLNTYFMLSLLAVPLAGVGYYLLHPDKELVSGMYSVDIFAKISYEPTLDNLLGNIGNSLISFFLMASVWIPLSLFGVWKHWRRNIALTIWYALIIIPVLSAPYLPWYFLPFATPLVYFSFLALAFDERKKIRFDKFFSLILTLFIVAQLAIGLIFMFNLKEGYENGRTVGKFLAFKENVQIIGEYAPTIVAYKILEEKREYGDYLDFGWILIMENATKEVVDDFAKDYWTEKYNITEGHFNRIMWDKTIFRKKTNITKFEYTVISYHDHNITEKAIIELRKG